MEGNSESRAKDETHRSVKPPDQYVISYNFEHAHSLNFTHNLLIGVGHPTSKPPRNNHSLPQQPQDKSKLYSIISQPTRVFRSDTRAVATTYQAAPLPKRYRNLPNSTTHQNSSNSNQNSSPDKENFRRVLSKEPKNNQESRIPILKNVVQQQLVEEQHKRSPYAMKGPQKNMKKDKFRVICNEVTEEEPEGSNEQHRSKKIRTKQIRSSNERSIHNNRNVDQTANLKAKKDRQHSDSPHFRKQNSQHSLSSGKHDQNLSAPLEQQHVSLTDLSEEVAANRQPMETLDFENNKLPSNELKVKEAEVVKIPSRKEIQDEQMREIQEIARREQSGKMKKGYYKVSGNKEAQILPFQNNVEPLFTKDARARKLKTVQTAKNISNNTKIEKQGKSIETAKSNIKGNHSETANTFNSPTNAKNERKPKYFGKEPANSANPRRDSTGNKTKINSFQVQAKANTSYSNAPQSNLSQIDEIKTSPSHGNPIANRNKASASSDYIGNKRNASNNVQLQKDSQFQRNPSQFIKTSHIKKANDVSIINRNSETQQVPLKKSANLQAIAAAKRNTKIKPSLIETEKPDNIKPNEEENVEDLTENNQIKGFKIPPKVLQSANNQSLVQDQPRKEGKIKQENHKNGAKDEKQTKKYNDLHSERSQGMKNSGKNSQSPALKNSPQIRSSHMGKEETLTSRQQKIKANPSEHSSRKDSLSNAKLVDKRQSRDKQRNMKNWKEAQMAKAQKESRQTKRRESKRQPPKMEHKIKKEKKVEPIDLDAAEKDTFGLHSKKKAAKPPAKKKQQKGQKQSQSHPAQNESIEEIAEQSEEIAKNSNSSRSQRNSEDEQHIQDSDDQLKLRNSAEGQAGLITVNESMGKISRIGSSRAVPEQTIIPYSNQDLQMGEPIQRLQSLQHNQEDDLETLLEAANAQTPITEQYTHRSALKSNRQTAEKHQNNLQSSGFKQDHICEQNKMKQNDIEVIELNKVSNINITPEEVHQQPREVQKAIVQGQNKQNEIGNIQNPDGDLKPVLNEQLECSQMGQGHQGQVGASRSQDFFQYNIKQISKFNQSLNQTVNVTKYESFDRDPSNYTRAPILSLIYPPNSHPFASSSNRLPAVFTHSKPIGHSLLDQTVDLLLSIDSWILERIFEPFSSEKGQTGVWLYCYGQWKLYLISGQDNFRGVLLRAVQAATNSLGIDEELQSWLRLLSGVRVVRVKSGKKRVFSELQFSLRKGHCVRAQTAENSKWGRRLFAVAQVVVSREGENVLQVREGQDVFWVKQEKFREIFDHFLLICTRKSHFWTSRPISPPENHKAVLALSSSAAAHGSVTLFYPSSKPASLLLYKELESRVLRFMGKIEQKPNLNGNLYFQFRLHGNYCLFLEAPADCLLAVQSTTPLEVGTAEFVRSQTLKNEQCEYVELDKAPGRSSVNGKLQQLRERFIKMVIKQ